MQLIEGLPIDFSLCCSLVIAILFAIANFKFFFASVRNLEMTQVLLCSHTLTLD